MLFQIKNQSELNFKNIQEKFDLDCGFIEELTQFMLENLETVDKQKLVKNFDSEFHVFDFYFMIGAIKNHPGRPLRIRNNELLLLSSLSENIKEQLDRKMEIEKSANQGMKAYVVLNENKSEDYGVLHVRKTSKRVDFATDYAHKELMKSLGVLNFLNHSLSLSFYKYFHDCYIVMKDETSFPPYKNVETENTYYLDNQIIDNLSYITDIYQKSKKSDIDKRIIKSLEVYSQVQKSTEPIVKILIYMTMLENLLIDEKDKDYLGWKLADRISFLIGNRKPVVDEIIFPEFRVKYPNMNRNSRYVIAEFVKDLYDIRSRYVHSSKSNKEIGLFDKYLLIGYNILHETMSEFLKLESIGITSLKGKGGLIEYLEIEKYVGHNN